MIILLISLLLLFFGISLTVISHGVQMYGLLLIWFGLLVFAGGWRLKKARWRMHTCLALAAATVLGIILLDIPIIRDAKTDTAPGADYVIILGAAVYGTQPSPSLRDRLDAVNPEAGIEVDGGVSPATIGRIAEAGANIFVAGSAIYGQADYSAVIAAMKHTILLHRGGPSHAV